jgi:hypothetical protein
MSIQDTIGKAIGGFLQAFGVSSPQSAKKKTAKSTSPQPPANQKPEKPA